MKCLYGSTVTMCTCGEQLIKTVMFWTFWCNDAITELPPNASSETSCKDRATRRDKLSLIGFAVARQRFERYCQTRFTSRVAMQTTGRRTRISIRVDENDRCSDSSQQIRHSVFYRSTRGFAICFVMVGICCERRIIGSCVVGRFRLGRWLRTSDDNGAAVICSYFEQRDNACARRVEHLVC